MGVGWVREKVDGISHQHLTILTDAIVFDHNPSSNMRYESCPPPPSLSPDGQQLLNHLVEAWVQIPLDDKHQGGRGRRGG